MCDKGKELTLKINCEKDWDREIIKSEFGTLKIAAIQLEIPSSRGVSWLRPLEGVFASVIEDLEKDQPLRKIQDEENYIKIND